MTDRKPPRTAGDERAVLTSLLQYCRDSVVRKVEGIDDEQATWSPVPSGTSLLWLVNHLADAETTWVIERFAGEPAAGRSQEATLDAAVARYRRTSAHADAIVQASSLDALCRAPDVEPVPDLRWVLAHLVEETARHAGHADLLRELLDGSTGR